MDHAMTHYDKTLVVMAVTAHGSPLNGHSI
jgi:hypothetical protein